MFPWALGPEQIMLQTFPQIGAQFLQKSECDTGDGWTIALSESESKSEVCTHAHARTMTQSTY